ncbi:MAG: hypothetical protein H0V12_04120 [Chloroflexi bacterium]|nr:hypothetical protein [Chloroflexota bacterium]
MYDIVYGVYGSTGRLGIIDISSPVALGGEPPSVLGVETASGIPATAATTAVIATLRILGARRIDVATPSPSDVNEAERRFLGAMGFEVVHLEGLNLRSDREIGALPLERVECLALSVVQTPSDVVFLSCTNRLTLPLFDDLGSTAGLSSAATRPPSGTRCAG